MGTAAFRQARDFLFAHRTDHAAAHRGFAWPRLETFNYALDWFDAELAAGPLGNSTALRIMGEGAATRSFAELSAESTRLANGLRAMGVQRGDRILLMLGNVVPLWETMLAAMKLGAVVVPATTLLTPADLSDRFARGRVRHVVAGAADTAKFAGLGHGFTRISVGEASGWSCFFAPWNAGATVFVNNQPRFDARGTLESIAAGGVTTFCAPPTVWRMLVQQDMAPHRGTLRELCSAGEPLNPEVIEHVRKAWGMTIREGYGQTETTLQIGYFPGQAVKPGCMGHEAPGYRIRLLDPEDREVAEGEVALLLDPAPLGLMRGYQQEDGSLAGVGGLAYRTGDVASRDAEGHFAYVGRADDVFKASDYRISPFELESVLVEHEAVMEAAVVPAPDALRLAVPKAFVVLAPGAEAGRETMLSIFRHLRERLSPYKRVRRIEACELPKTISGKIRRVELRRTEEERFRAGRRGEGEFREEDFPELA